jgi:hypothetical protein
LASFARGEEEKPGKLSLKEEGKHSFLAQLQSGLNDGKIETSKVELYSRCQIMQLYLLLL